MNPATYEDIVAYGKSIKAVYPSISANDLKKALLVKFVGGKDILPIVSTAVSAGIICNPIIDYLAILSIIFNSLRKVFTQDKTKLVAVQGQIDRAVAYLSLIK